MLTQDNEIALNEFLETTGALDGLDPTQAKAICVDLVWTVSLIVTEAVDRNLTPPSKVASGRKTFQKRSVLAR